MCVAGEAYFYENIPRAFVSLFPRLLAIECASGGRDLLSLRLQRVNGVTLSRLHISQCITSGRLEILLDALKRLHSCTNAEAQDCNSLPNVWPTFRSSTFRMMTTILFFPFCDTKYSLHMMDVVVSIVCTSARTVSDI